MDPLNIVQGPAVQPLPPGPVPAPASMGSGAGAPRANDPRLQTPHLESVVRELNSAMQAVNTSISFSIDSATGKTVIKVTDAGTGQLIRQIPTEEMLSIAARINELMGVLYDKTR